MKKYLNLSLVFILILSACNHSKVDKLEPVNDSTFNALQHLSYSKLDSVNKSHQSALFLTNGASSDQSDFWNAAFKTCFKSSQVRGNGLFDNRLLYLGPSNTFYLGAIFDDKLRSRTDLSFVSEGDMKKFVNIGVSVDNCDLTKVRSISLDFVVSANVVKTVDASLATTLKNADSVIVTGGAWRVDAIKIDDFLNYLNAGTSPEIVSYRKSLLAKNNKVITTIIKVDGFTAEAYSKSDFSTELKAKLDSAVTVKLANANASVKFTSDGSKKVKISSTNSFYIFANVYKGTSLGSN